MKTAPIVTARVELRDGVPFAPNFGDLYHPRAGAFAQARDVFLAGNGLPERWRGRERFVVLETGFGLGNNFLATWDAWRGDPRRCAGLHFISLEKHPLTRDDLARLHANSPLPAAVRQLVQAWPSLTPNLHRLAFDAGRVQLLLALGDVADWLPEIVASVDAFFLDGFAPDRNPAMWQPRVFKALGRLAAPNATVATWSAARVVRAGLDAAGFEVRSAPGSAGKREITLARYAPRFAPRRAPSRLGEPRANGDRHAIVVGAGLAGCSAAWALAGQGWHSTLFDRLGSIAAAASGNIGGVFHGIVNAQDGAHARFNRAAALQAREAVLEAIASHGVAGQAGGLLRFAADATVETLAAPLRSLALPADFVQALDAGAVSAISGVPRVAPAWFFPGGGWVHPGGLAASYLARAASSVEFRPNADIGTVRQRDGRWQVLDASANVLAEAAVLVLANAFDVACLIAPTHLPLQRVRGQTTELPLATPGLRLPLLPLTGNGYVLPVLPNGLALFGATAQRGDEDPKLRASDQQHNLRQLVRLTGSAPCVASAAPTGRVGWRCVAPDRLPLIGAVPDEQALRRHGTRLDQPRFVPRMPGLYLFTGLASRGITWSALSAQTLAALVSGAPCPLEASLLDAVDAARFASRAARRPVPGAERPAGGAPSA